MKKKLPDLKIRVDDALRSLIDAEIERRKAINPDDAKVSRVVRDALRSFLLSDVQTKAPKRQDSSHRSKKAA